VLTRTVASGQAETTLRWIRWADADYLGARILLVQGLLIQGAALANTALEKYLKAVCCHSGMKIPHGHAVDVLYSKVVGHNPTNLALNESYLRLLRKAYKLRYPEELNDGYNIALNQAKLLSQLDRSVLEITKRFEIKLPDGKTIPMVLDEARMQQHEVFLAKNVAVDPARSALLFSNPSHSYEIRNHKGNLYQVPYQSLHIKDDLVFEVEGFVPQNDLQFTVAFPPIVPGTG
jgi:HEPN domain-containing protein